ncbi:membralin isoform X2 [Drosophila willistoni]|uniref:membralin isoform X2 n=1 Tax=Drosophila willistoni TaxID=7260 RepID=UPI001F083C05|nr:membralin isoform X2 [Drosophila willistoni]
MADIAVANAINRLPGVIGDGEGGRQNVMNMRDRLFHAIYFRAAATYAELVPRKVQLFIEYLLLAKALLFFLTLIYVHNAFIKNPCTCLQIVNNWPREGVVRVEIIPRLAEKRRIWQEIKRDQHLLRSIKKSYYYGLGPQTRANYLKLKRYDAVLRSLGKYTHSSSVYTNDSLYYYFDVVNILDNYDYPSAIQLMTKDNDDQYIVEYSLEYGYLRLSSATRKRLNIPVLTVQLDPSTNPCFGDRISRYLLKRLLGYDDLLMASVRTVAEQDENKGYLRNVITGEHYRFVSMWWTAWSSYPAAFGVMLLFTLSVSMLLRYSHHQIFVFIERRGRKLKISAELGKRIVRERLRSFASAVKIQEGTKVPASGWTVRFFYLYHFAFYAYHYRFSGQYRTLALLSSYLFIQHSMIFFFHRYELPAIMAQRNMFIIARNQVNRTRGAGAGADAANVVPNGRQASLSGARLIVMRFFRQIAAQRLTERQSNQQRQEEREAQAQRQQEANLFTVSLGIALVHLRRLPVVGQWLQRREQFSTARRVFIGYGGNGTIIHDNLRRVNVENRAQTIRNPNYITTTRGGESFEVGETQTTSRIACISGVEGNQQRRYTTRANTLGSPNVTPNPEMPESKSSEQRRAIKIVTFDVLNIKEQTIMPSITNNNNLVGAKQEDRRGQDTDEMQMEETTEPA